jgi:recombination protein RecA
LTNWTKPTERNSDEMGDKAIVEVETISSGSLGIDLALGLVDIKRKSYQIYGPRIIWKTTTLLQHCRSSKAGGIAAFIDAEHAFDRNYAEKLG